MFEQELERAEAEKQAEAYASAEGELFANYEIKPWVFTPRIYKIIAAAAIINIVSVLVLAQTQILTMKGCDSPFVGRVCRVLDTVYVGSVLFGTDREYADVAYERTELAEAEITYIDVSNVSPPLSYPEGYFQIANPVQYAMLKEQAANQTPGIPGIPSFTPNSNIANELRNTKPVLPKANPNVVEGEIPDSLFEFETDDETKDDIEKVNRPRGGKVAGTDPKGQTPDGQTAANDNTKMPEDPAETETQDVSKQDQFGVFINKRPIRDMAFEALEKVEKKEVTLEKPFKVVIAATLAAGKDGKTIVLKDPRMVPTEFDATNDPAMVKLVQDAIIASGDAGWFGYLHMFDVRNVIITVEQNNESLTASVRSDQPSEDLAKRVASGFNGILAIAVGTANGDEKKFLELAKTTQDGKAFLVSFEIPKALAQEMIMRELQKVKEDPKRPNGNASVAKDNNNSK